MDGYSHSPEQDEQDGEASASSRAISVFTFTFGTFNQLTPWTDRQSLSWTDLALRLTSHEVGPKEGTCIVPAVFRGTRRHKSDADQIDVVFLDSDTGAALEEIRAAISARDFRAVISSTHNHQTTTTSVKRGNWDKFRAKHPDAVTAAEAYLVEDKGYRADIATGAVVIDETGDTVTFQHQPCPKFRIAIPLERPWRAGSYDTQTAANAAWKERIEALAAALNLRHDQSCTDTSRLFYLPRRPADGPTVETAILDGIACDIFALPPAPKASGHPGGGRDSKAGSARRSRRRGAETHPLDPITYSDPVTGEVADLRAWGRNYARRFEIVTALRARKSGVFTGKVLDHKHHLSCVNAAAHTTADDDQATFVMNASQSEKGWFLHHCRHNHCDGREHLLFLKQMLEQQWLQIEDLTDPQFLCEPRDVTPDGSAELTEHGVAVVFVERHQDDLRYCHTSGSWYLWTGTHWAVNRTRLAFSWARRLTASLNRTSDFKTQAITGKASFAAAVERFAQADEALAVTSDFWDQDPLLLGTPGGVVDLRTGLLRSAARTDYIARITAVAPSAAADCPHWLAFLDQATGGDAALAAFLQRWFGYCLTGITREHALLFVYGPGGNGKGVLLVTIAGILGAYAVTAALDTFTASKGERHPTDLAMLAGARLVMTTETEEGRAWAEARIKAMTGGDPVTARFMRQDFFTYMPAFKLTISGNHKPALRSVDDAAWRRFNVVPFVHRPAAPDPQLSDKLRAEWPGILRWMIDGCLAWQRDGLARPKAVLDATAEYFAEQDVLAQWIEECCEIGTGFGETSSKLFASWRAFAQGRSDEPHNAKWLGAMLERQGHRRAKDCAMFRGRGYVGIRLLPEPAAKPWNETDA
ncbi:phage/plasmid primase, P4 family [Roseomonas sp. CAU 1739]|uniref:phage/plasmid primase, P4 family n=1 Tax=Roseomonas sp. CAU 1739 TaxID=3140364 RepID=UPI00325B076C